MSEEQIIAETKKLSKCLDIIEKEFLMPYFSYDTIHNGNLRKLVNDTISSWTCTYTINEDKLVENAGFYFRHSQKRSYPFYKELRKRITNIEALSSSRILIPDTTEGNGYFKNVKYNNPSDYLLDYTSAKNKCQLACVHIMSDNSTGTGFFVSKDGYAITCAHVVENLDEVMGASFYGSEKYDIAFGKIISINKTHDLALLQFEIACDYLPIYEGPELPDIGDEVVMYGYPLGFNISQEAWLSPYISFTKGYVSSNQKVDNFSRIYVDISAMRGNSGSPIISVKSGKVIGVISGIQTMAHPLLKQQLPYVVPIQYCFKL